LSRTKPTRVAVPTEEEEALEKIMQTKLLAHAFEILCPISKYKKIHLRSKATEHYAVCL